MPLETPPAIVRPAAADPLPHLIRARELLGRAETSAVECGRELLIARELCVQQGREWLAELARCDIPRSSAHRYMRQALDHDQPQEKSTMSRAGHGGQEEEKAAPAAEDDDPPTPVRRRENADDADDPKAEARREALDCLAGLLRALPRLDLLDRHAAELHRLRHDLARA